MCERMDEMIRFQCPHCSKKLKVADAAAGQNVHCTDSACGRLTRLPSLAEMESLPWLEALDGQAPNVVNPHDLAAMLKNQAGPASGASSRSDRLGVVQRTREARKLRKQVAELEAALRVKYREL